MSFIVLISCEFVSSDPPEYHDFGGCAHTEVFVSLPNPDDVLLLRAFLCAEEPDGRGRGRIELAESIEYPQPAGLWAEYDGASMTLWDDDAPEAWCEDGIEVRIGRTDARRESPHAWFIVQATADEPEACSVRVEREESAR